MNVKAGTSERDTGKQNSDEVKYLVEWLSTKLSA